MENLDGSNINRMPRQNASKIEKKIPEIDAKTSELKENISKLEKTKPNINDHSVNEQKAFLAKFKEGGNEAEIDEHMAAELEHLFSAFVIKMDPKSPFANTDLVIFKDSYSGSMPINGIKESEFKKISETFQKISSEPSKFQILCDKQEFRDSVVDALKTLLTRDISRRLIDKIISTKPLIILDGKINRVIEIEHEGNKIPLIEFNIHQKLFVTEILPSGEIRLRKQPLPIFITLVHEMGHLSHGDDTKAIKYRDNAAPTFEKEYHNLEEQFTITGSAKDVPLGEKLSNAELAKSYDEFNEWNITAAFTDSKHIWYPRFGHIGIEKNNLDLSNKTEVASHIYQLIYNELFFDLSEFLKESKIDLRSFLTEEESANIFEEIATHGSFNSIDYFVKNNFIDEEGKSIQYYLVKFQNQEDFKMLSDNIDFLQTSKQGLTLLESLFNEINSSMSMRIASGLSEYIDPLFKWIDNMKVIAIKLDQGGIDNPITLDKIKNLESHLVMSIKDQ
jgi:hypothetical protein